LKKYHKSHVEDVLKIIFFSLLSSAFAAPSMAEARTMAAPGSAKVRFGTTQPGKVDVRGTVVGLIIVKYKLLCVL
jgi:hypothetical protein